MPQIFDYVAVDAGGQRQVGAVTAESPDEALGSLRRSGLRPVTVSAASTGSLNFEIDGVALLLRLLAAAGVFAVVRTIYALVNQGLPLGTVVPAIVALTMAAGLPARRIEEFRGAILRVKPTHLAVFARQLSTLISAGLPLLRCLDTLAQQTEDKRFTDVIRRVRADVAAGTPFSDALAVFPKYFDAFFVATIRAGENSGDLDIVLARLARSVERNADLRRKVKSAMRYPLTIFGLSMLIVAVMLVTLVPRFEDIFAQLDGQLPLPTRLIVRSSELLTRYFVVVLVAAVVVFVGFLRWRRTSSGELIVDRALLKVPVIGLLLKKVGLARFASSLGLLTKSGISILDALEISRQTVRNRYIADALGAARHEVRTGTGLADAIEHHDVFPPMVIQMVAVGERTGRLDDLMEKVAEFYEAETDATVASLTSLVQPIMMVVMGSVIGVMVVSLYLPMFQVINQIK
jgi:type IV pilus assembly protein PilC